jgi:hypothetical protein
MPGETVLLVNPSTRRSRRHHRRSNPRRHHARRRRNPMGMFVAGRAMNPRRRHHARRRRNPITQSMYRSAFRRNPIGLGGTGALLADAAWGAAGALTVNLVVNQAPIPATLNSGLGGFATRGLAAVLLGMLGRKMGFGARAHKMALGSMTVTLTDLTRSTLAPMFPAVNLSGLGFYSPAMLATRPALPYRANQAQPAIRALPGNVTALHGAKIGGGKLGMFVAGRGR